MNWIKTTDQPPELFVPVLVHIFGEIPLPGVHEGYLGPREKWHVGGFAYTLHDVYQWAEMPEPPLVHGRWIKLDPNSTGRRLVKCSVCGIRNRNQEQHHDNYCPICGAKMLEPPQEDGHYDKSVL